MLMIRILIKGSILKTYKNIIVIISLILFFSCNHKKNETPVKTPIVKNEITYKYDISGFSYISYENQGLKDVEIKLINHKQESIKKIKTDYSGRFSFKGEGKGLKPQELSKWYISLNKTRYKSVKIPLKNWQKKGSTYLFTDNKLNINIKCAKRACMDKCCTENEICSHPHTKGAGFASCRKIR